MRRHAAIRKFSSAEKAFLLLGQGTTGVTMAPLWRRVAAFLVDCVVSSPLLLFAALMYQRMLITPMVFPDGLAWYDAFATGFARWPGLIPGLLVACVVTFLLFRTALSLALGRTPGMLLLGIRFQTAQCGRPSPVAIAFREFFALVSIVILGAGYLWAVFDDAMRPWHDKIMGLYAVMDER
ncbi:RDD family protein [Myxococcota bacterium]|nr:RDD family protein [Myxococcota bacterium]MBU1536970.1 RDD family protein [Myxococcota bacterium]